MKKLITVLMGLCSIQTGPSTVRFQVAENRQIYRLEPARLPQHRDPQRKGVYDPPCSPAPPLLRGGGILIVVNSFLSPSKTNSSCFGCQCPLVLDNLSLLSCSKVWSYSFRRGIGSDFARTLIAWWINLKQCKKKFFYFFKNYYWQFLDWQASFSSFIFSYVCNP